MRSAGRGLSVADVSAQSSIVFCHGLWADGSCFSKMVGPLQVEGHEVIAAPYGLDISSSPTSRQ